MTKPMDRIETVKGVTRYFLTHKEVTQEEYEAVYPPVPMGGGSPGGTQTKGWPIHSDALCYHPKQIQEATAYLAAKGVPTEIDRMGRPILTDRGHRKRLLRALGKHDNNGGYGD